MESNSSDDREMANEEPSKAAASEDIERAELELKLELAMKRAEEYLDLLRRVQADFTNYRRRVEQERGENANSIKAEILGTMLPVLDDFQHGIDAIPNGSRGLPWVQGMSMIERKLHNVLEAAGVIIINPQGQDFNPWEHEAVLHEPTASYEAGKVIEVLRPGYRLDSKIIRPAQVKVAAPMITE